MRLSGTLLSGTGFGSFLGDGLSLDLAFALDKTLTARRGPTPVFTRASTGTFVGSNGFIQSAAINAPRFDYDPVALECKGLLIEESRTNLAINSQTPSGWISGNGTVTDQGLTTSPSGLNDGYLAGVDTADISPANTSSLPSGAYTISVFLKRNNTNWVILQLNHGTNTNIANAWFNLATGVKGSVSAGAGSLTSITSAITNVGNGWYRCSITATIPTSGAVRAIIISTPSDANAARVSGAIYAIWGFQIEAGAFPTSYIPTTTSALTRSADVCSISGADFSSFYNQSEGTLFASGITRGYLVMASSGANSNQIAIFRNPSPLYMRFDVAVGGSYGAQINGATIIGDSFNKIAGAYAANNVRTAFNGALGTQDTTVAIPSNLTTLNIGSQSLGAAPHSGHVTHIQYFNKSLSNAKLQSLTT